MKKFYISFLISIASFFFIIPSFATDTGSCPSGQTAGTNGCVSQNQDITTDNLLGLPTEDLRAGNVNQNTILQVIVNVISVLLGLAGTIAVFSLIYHAVQMQINSGITGDSSGVDKAKKGMIGALIGFVIAISAWFLITRAIELLSSAS